MYHHVLAKSYLSHRIFVYVLSQVGPWDRFQDCSHWKIRKKYLILADLNWLPCIGVELDDSAPPGSVERNELVDVSVLPILSLLLEKVKTKQPAHAVTYQSHPPFTRSKQWHADYNDWMEIRIWILPFKSILNQSFESIKILSLWLRTQSEVIRGCSKDKEIDF